MRYARFQCGVLLAVLVLFAAAMVAEAQTSGGRGIAVGARPGAIGAAPADEEADVVDLTPYEGPPETIEEDSWYLILVGDEAVGWYHLSVTQLPHRDEDGAFRVTEEVQFSATVAEKSTLRPRESEIFLRSNLQVMDALLSVAGGEGGEIPTMTMTMRFENRTRSVEVAVPGQWTRTEKLPANWHVFCEARLGRLLKGGGLLEAGRRRTVKFLGKPAAEGAAAKHYREVTVEVREKGKRNVLGQDVDVFLVTLEGGAEAGGADNYYDAEGRLVASKVGGALYRLSDEQSARGTTEWSFRAEGRRDPMVPVITPTVVVDPKIPITNDEKLITASEAEKFVSEAQLALTQMKLLAEVPEDNPSRESGLQENYKRIMEIKETIFRDKSGEEFRRSIEQIGQDAEKLYPIVRRLLAKAQVIHAEASDVFYMQAPIFGAEVYKQIPGLLSRMQEIAQNSILSTDPSVRQEVMKLQTELEDFNRRGQIRLDFFSKKIRTTGIVYVLKERTLPLRVGFDLFGASSFVDLTLEVPASQSMAIIGDQTVAEGANLDKLADDLSVKRIERDGVIFSYHGEDIKLEFK